MTEKLSSQTTNLAWANSAEEISDGLIERLLRDADISIRCRVSDAPAGLQWIFGWIVEYKGRSFCVSGGATKREIYNHFTNEFGVVDRQVYETLASKMTNK